MRTVVVIGTEQAIRELEAIALKAHGSEFPKQPDRIGAECARRGMSIDPENTRRLHNGDRWGWVNRPADAEPTITAGVWRIDIASLSVPSTDEIPDPAERAIETARVNANLARLTVQERATVNQALAQGQGGGSVQPR